MCPTQFDVKLSQVVYPSNLCKSMQRCPWIPLTIQSIDN
jgi:hypothetical protein